MLFSPRSASSSLQLLASVIDHERNSRRAYYNVHLCSSFELCLWIVLQVISHSTLLVQSDYFNRVIFMIAIGVFAYFTHRIRSLTT